MSREFVSLANNTLLKTNCQSFTDTLLTNDNQNFGHLFVFLFLVSPIRVHLKAMCGGSNVELPIQKQTRVLQSLHVVMSYVDC